MSRRFPYAVDIRFAPIWLAFGVRPSTDGVTLTDDGFFKATFGFLRLATPLDNVTGAHITRGYRWWTAIGARRSFVDDGLSFGTNATAGVCLHFAAKVPSPVSRKGHSALTVTVADLDGLVQALSH
jgi:pyocin large subunit-like protein